MSTVAKVRTFEDRQVSEWLVRVQREERWLGWLWLASGALVTAFVGVSVSATVTWFG